jgi:hypothetical protein
MTFFLFQKEEETSSFKTTALSFVWHRISDILVFVGIFSFGWHKISIGFENLSLDFGNKFNWPSALFFIGLLLRASLISAPLRSSSLNYNELWCCRSFHALSCGFGALIIYFNTKIMLLNNTSYHWFPILTLLIIFILNIVDLITNNQRFKLDISIFYAFITLNLLLISLNKFYFASLLGSFTLFTFPIYSYLLAKFAERKKNKNTTSSIIYLKGGHFTLDSMLFRIPFAFANGISEILARFVAPFYADFLFFHFPRILIGSIQLPLRIIFNGNILRVIFLIFTGSVALLYFGGLG